MALLSDSDARHRPAAPPPSALRDDEPPPARFMPIADSPIGAFADRAVALLVLAAAAVVCVLLLQVTPDPRGHGTHVALGMPPCGWVVAYGAPCPTCGVTTAATHLVHLQPLRALAVQPFGAVLAAAGLWLAAVAAWCLFRGRSLMEWMVRLPHVRLLLWGTVLLVGAWGYKYLTF